MNLIELDKASLSTVPFDKVMYLSIAERGAMGCPGEILMVTADRILYCADYCRGDITYSDIVAAFPVLGMCRFGFLGQGSVTPEMWNYVDLGMGNHLIVHNDVYPEFKKKTKDLPPHEIYAKWVDIALHRKNHQYPAI